MFSYLANFQKLFFKFYQDCNIYCNGMIVILLSIFDDMPI